MNPDPRPAFYLQDVNRADFIAVTAPTATRLPLNKVTDLRILLAVLPKIPSWIPPTTRPSKPCHKTGCPMSRFWDMGLPHARRRGDTLRKIRITAPSTPASHKASASTALTSSPPPHPSLTRMRNLTRRRVPFFHQLPALVEGNRVGRCHRSLVEEQINI